jgi:hypothetical protein
MIHILRGRGRDMLGLWPLGLGLGTNVCIMARETSRVKSLVLQDCSPCSQDEHRLRTGCQDGDAE